MDYGAPSPYNVYPVTRYLGARIVFLFGALSCISVYCMTSEQMKVISLTSGLVSTSAHLFGYASAYSVLGSGGLERMIFHPVFLWEICSGGYLLNNVSYTAVN